jgi:hypothetical protein
MERLPLLPLPTRKLEDDTPSPVQLPPLEAGTDAGAGASKSASPASVRQLTVTEINNFVRPEFESRGNALPDLSQAAFFGVMRDGRLTGSFITLQLRLHADPVLLVEGDEAMLGSLVSAVKQHIVNTVGVADVYVFTPPGNTERLAQLFGMQAEPWTVFSKRVSGADLRKESEN